MRTLKSHLAGDEISIYVYQDGDSFGAFADFIARTEYIGFDTESSGGPAWDDGWSPRLAQFGSADEAHVLPAHMGRQIRAALAAARVLVMHSAPADCITAALGWGADPGKLAEKTLDTLILSRLIDPMGHSTREQGRLHSLHGLKARVRQLVDPGYDADVQLKRKFREGCNWGTVPLSDPVYLRYAGLDPVITVRLLETLWFLGSSPLISREHRLMRECMLMTWRGMRIDQEYRRDLSARLDDEADACHRSARMLGFPADTITLGRDKAAVAEWLGQQGIKVPSTPKGRPSLAKPGLLAAVRESAAGPAVSAFFEGKELRKLNADYLSKMDTSRVHPDIRSIGAVTGRMSVGSPPFHQLPDAVRGCVVPDAGLLGSADLNRIEFCVAAGLAQDRAMMDVLRAGEDLHLRTARQVYPHMDFTEPLGKAAKAARQRAKVAGFARMYGGGPATIAEAAGCDADIMRSFVQGFDLAYPAVRQTARRLSQLDWVVNPWGRRIPADPLRKYGNLNYQVQSTAREIFADGMLRCIDAGIRVLLPLHDEVIFQGEPGALETVIECMSGEFMGVPVRAEGKMMERWSK